MIKEIRIDNFKSIQSVNLNFGRITILIGENGCGKSNILEAIALASAAMNNKLDNEFLVARGVRVTEPKYMRAAFDSNNISKVIKLYIETDKGNTVDFALHNDNKPYSQWVQNTLDKKNDLDLIILGALGGALLGKNLLGTFLGGALGALLGEKPKKNREKIKQRISELENFLPLFNFLIYSPEIVSLRLFEKEGQIQPLGINGEGLLKLIKVLSSNIDKKKIDEIKEKLRLIEWFEDFDVVKDSTENEQVIKIKDKYLDKNLAYFDQKSSNEGFLFLLFYFSLFISDNTPNFFSIDNIDASLNPKLCSQLVKELVELSKKYNKQAIFTTHNPAILDGLNLDDDEQRLFVVYRNKFGHTTVKRIFKPKVIEGQNPVKLSEAFLRGYLGGLPKSF